jgi:hypothetical protein
MELNEIIKNDSDRLFIVDTECFIIFTGDSIQDDRPFIRIGTWMDLPVEIIPLIENIIITDSIKGDPSHEQFNIDIRHFQSNRYIGSEISLKRFLDYQRNFGLDLTNVSIVNVDRDVPELPKKRNISDRDHFIGVFYSNGDVKIVHSGRDLFSLQKLEEVYPDISAIHEGIADLSRNSERYSNSGFIIFDANPLFYSSGYFTSYQYPGNYYSRFSRMNINPSKIRELILPSQNIVNISGLLKYKNSREGKIKLFSDNSDQADLIKKLFRNAAIVDEKFSSMNYNTGDGLKIESLGNTPNLKLTYKENKKHPREIRVIFLKSHMGAKSILKEKSDAIIITYTAYEESSLLFNSTDTPVLILNDGNPNIKKLHNIDRDILINGVQYELAAYETVDDLSLNLIGDNELPAAFGNNRIPEINSIFESIPSDRKNCLKLFNALSLLKVYIMNTTDRKACASLKNIYQKNITRINFRTIEEKSDSLKSVLAFLGKGCYQFLEEVRLIPQKEYSDIYNESVSQNENLSEDQKKLCYRIIEDRERLMKLINLFYQDREGTENYDNMRSEINKLAKEIKNRKEVYSQEIYLDETNTVVKSALEKISPISKGSSGKKNKVHETKNGYKAESALPGLAKEKIKYLAAVIVFLLLILMALLFSPDKDEDKTKPVITEDEIISSDSDKDNIVTVARINADEKELLKKAGVAISNLDIYNYANDVAEKNGYTKISYQGFKSRNPHWIFPGNLFVMLDGEKVVVQKGDTLWDLSKAKLEKMNAEFFKIVEEINSIPETENSRIKTLLEKADSYVYIDQQKTIISDLKKKYLNEQ